MCKKTFFLISLLLVLGLVGSTMATTWYVDNAVASSGNGQSWATAFKNFSDIVWGSVAAGDFIYISGGSSGGTKTYTESWSVGASGTSGNPITIAIDAANSSHNGTAVFDYNALGDYATVDGIFLSGRSYITISGNVNGQNHIAFKNLRNITNRTAASCIVGWGNTAITIDHIDVTNCNNGVRLWSGTAGTGYEVMYSNFTQIRGDVAVMVSVSESTWDQVKIHDNYIEILYNSAVPPGESGNYGGADGFQTCSGTSIYRNTCKVTNTSSVYTSTQHPDMIQAQGNYLKVYDNDFIDLGDSAFDYDCYSNPTPHDVRIYNNLYRLVNSLDPYPEFFRLYISNSNALTSINNFKLLNNTYVDASGYYTIRFNGFKTNNPTGSGNEIKNNIFYNCNGGAQYEMIRIDGSTGFTDASFSFDGNIYYNSSQSNYIYYNGTAYTATDWIAAREPNGHTSAPTFVSYSSKNINNNLHLASTDNVAKDTGVSLGSYFTTDKDGITRPQGSAWDIGAYEYVSGANDTTAPSPDPMTWATEPYATGSSSISMTATTATDSSGVEYYFDCTAGGGSDSGWQDSTTYVDTGLSASTQYTYRVQARDKSANQNATAYSTTKSATTDSASGTYIDATFDSDADGFTYADITNGSYVDGSWNASYGYSGGGIRVRTGPGPTGGATDGQYSDGFSLSSAGWVTITLRYRLEMGEGFESNEYGEAYLMIDSTRYGNGTGDSLVRIVGNGNGGGTDDSGWLSGEFDVSLSSGSHTIKVGAYNNASTAADEWVNAYFDNVKVEDTNAPGDTTAPSPDPMTWATVPYATGSTSISMTATTATDASGVEYYFECTAGGGHSSSWQDSTTYQDTGLSELTQYTYRVKARDKSSNQNETAYSTSQSATTEDGTAPSPDPMTWATVPYNTGTSSISMTATTATDASGVEYYFDETTGNPGGHDSGWQASATYEDTGLDDLTQYTYRVKARDGSSNLNETAYSTSQSATTQDGTTPSPDPMTWGTEPYATGVSSISMTATTATDASGVEYYFDCTAGGGTDSAWQDSSTYEDTGLSASTQYTYQVKSRDKSSNYNETSYSTSKSATTDSEAGLEPVSWWKLDESSGTNADDSSGNNHDGTLTGGSWAPTSGKFDGAVDIGAANSDHVEVPTTGMSASAGTVSLWGRIEGTQTSSRYFFGHTSTTGWSDRIQLQMDEGDNYLDLGLGDSHNKDVDIMALSADTWYHIALTWDGSNYVVYVDGIEKASGTYTGLSTLGSIADIGNTGNSNERIEAFQGLLDDVRVYDEALSKYDIADLAGITIASSPSHADNATGVATDADLSWSAGHYAADVNGHDVYFGTDFNSVADANHSSAEFKGTQSSTTYDPGTMSDQTTYYWAIDEVNDSNTWIGDVWNFTTQSQDTTAPSPDPMTWATEPYATGATSISMTATTATDVSGVEYFFDCTTAGGHDSDWQDSTTYQDTALSSETQYSYKVQARDKSANHNATGWSTTKSATTDFDPNLVSLWRLDESSGTTAADSSGNSHDGTLNGGSWAPTSGKIDGAVELGDANSNRVQVPTTGMSLSAGTIALWGRIEGTQTSSRYFFGHTSAPGTWSDRIQLQMDEGDNYLDLGLGDSHNKDVDIMALSADTWYHIALTWDGTNYVVYVDGVSEASGTYTGLSTLNSIADIGNTGNSNERIEAFQGLLDEVRIYDRVLSADDVNDLYDL